MSLESFKENRYKWERTIEDVLIEIFHQKDENDLSIDIDFSPMTSVFIEKLNSMEAIIKESKNSKGRARLIPGNKYNED